MLGCEHWLGNESVCVESRQCQDDGSAKGSSALHCLNSSLERIAVSGALCAAGALRRLPDLDK